MPFWDIKETVSEALRTLLSDISTDLIQSGLKYLTKYIANPVELDEIPFYDTLTLYAQSFGSSLVILFLYLRIMGALKDTATGEGEPNYAGILGAAAISMGLVWSFPYAINHYAIPIINEIIGWIGLLEVETDLSNKVLTSIAPEAGLATAALHMLFMGVVFGIGAFILVIAAFINTAHLFIAVVCGPVLMASQTNQSGVFKSYLMELGAVLFTKAIHVLTFVLVVATAGKGTFESLLLSLAFLVAGAMGPFVLRSWLANSGVASGASSVGRMAMYKLVMKKG